GRAVWHDAEVTYAVAAPAATFGALRETYNIIHATIAAALRSLGVPAEQAGRSDSRASGLAGGSCFASPAGGEVVAGGRKLVGSAQVREGKAFLQHGSILLEDGQDVVSQVTKGTTIMPVATSISALLGRTVSFDEVAAAMKLRAQQDWPGEWLEAERPLADTSVARFADSEWTWRR
ncbi:MAG: hypothetical protein JSW51_02940, partial [Gemmatimonadota bacterium]